MSVNFDEAIIDIEKLRDYCELIPNGIQSGLKKDKGIRGIFFYYKYDEDYHFWYLYDAINDKFLTNKTEILDLIADNSEYGMDSLIKDMLSKGLPISHYPIQEYWLDIGQVGDYEKAQEIYKEHFQ